MEVETLRDVIRWTREVHSELSKCLSMCQEDNKDERAKLVLSYLSNHEHEIAKVVDIFEKKGSEHALNTWCVEYVNKFKLDNGEFCDRPFSDLDAQQIVAVVVEKHQYLLSLFRFLAMQAAIPSTKELLNALSFFEEHEIMKIVQATNRFEDV
ncbi:MAG: ATPase [Oleispira sp.]|nr:ATPase [Oleispira sp.]